MEVQLSYHKSNLSPDWVRLILVNYKCHLPLTLHPHSITRRAAAVTPAAGQCP